MNCPECRAAVDSIDLRRQVLTGFDDTTNLGVSAPGAPYLHLSPCGHEVTDRAAVESFLAEFGPRRTDPTVT